MKEIKSDKELIKDLPIINADPSSLGSKIIEVMKMNTIQRGQLADQGIVFLKKWHDPRKIAKRLLKDYKAVLAGRHINCI